MTETGRPGQSLYAPQARLVDPTSGTVLEDANDDIASIRIQQVNHGVSQVTVTLNNQQTFPANPRFPPWQYNDMQAFKFGQRVRVDFRYGGEAQWTPMILARITDLQFTFPVGAGATLAVVGEDLLSLLKIQDPQQKDNPYRDQQEVDIVNDCVRRAGVQAALPLGQPLKQRDVFSNPLTSEVHQKSQTFLQFIQQLGERLDYEVFVDFDARQVPEDAQPNQPRVELHFEPARSLVLQDVVDLSWGTNLVSFTPRFKIWEQYTQVTTKGRDPRRRQTVTGQAEESAVTEDLQSEGDTTPQSAISLRRRFFADDQPENPYSTSVTNLDADRATVNAKKLLRDRAREFISAEGSTIGFTAIRPGVHINVQGLRAPFDGLYYVTKAVHTLDSGGYKTSFTVRRPGMLPPEGYLAGEG